MRVERALLLAKEQRRIGAASNRSWADRVVKEGEKGLQDKGSASSALLNVCLHIFLLRDTASLERDRSMANGSNPPLVRPNPEQRRRSPSYLGGAATLPLVGVLLP